MNGDDGDGGMVRTTSPGDWSIRDEEARSYILEATASVASLVRSTFGPRGMELLIETQDPQGTREVVMAKDSAEIIAAIERGEGFNHPIAAVFIDAVDSMQRAIADGTTTSILLADMLVSRGIDLLDQGLAPTSVVIGYSMAATAAGATLDDLAQPVTAEDTDLLRAVARTSFPADLSRSNEYARYVARAVQGLARETSGSWLDTEEIAVVRTRGVEAGLHRGVIVRRWPRGVDAHEDMHGDFDWEPVIPQPIYDARIAIMDREIDVERTATHFATDPPEHQGSGVLLSTFEDFETYETGRREQLAAVASGFRDLGVDVLVAQPRLEPDVVNALRAVDIAVVDHANLPERTIYRLARATGGTVITHPDDASPERIGTAGRAVEYRFDEEKWAIFDQCDGGVFTIAAPADTVSAAERQVHLIDDAVELTAMAINDGQAIPGGGAAAMAVATALREEARGIPSKEQLAVEAFADALEELVYFFAENMGHDPVTTRSALRSVHSEGETTMGIDLETGQPADMWAAGVIEPRRVFSQAIETARTAVDQLLTVDAILFPSVDLDTFTPRPEHN